MIPPSSLKTQTKTRTRELSIVNEATSSTDELKDTRVRVALGESDKMNQTTTNESQNGKELLAFAAWALQDPTGGFRSLQEAEKALNAAEAVIRIDGSATQKEYEVLRLEALQRKQSYKRKTKALFRKMKKTIR